jgi:pyrimidine-nucleoside phosphorylase
VDKHSTGGVGDKTTLIMGPLVAAAGVPVAKMSGRGLGHTGGTIDKLEAIPGFNTALPKDRFIDNVNRIKIAIGGQTGNLAPADKRLYALRDVTATVDSIPLIASSVMSKKIAAGADAIVLDVKTGSGAFMKSVDQAISLAEAMVKIGSEVGRQTIALITDMDQPLGNTVGNALEVKEAIECLRGQGPKDLTELCLALGSQMVFLAGKAENPEKAREELERILHQGTGLEKLKEMVRNQGGDTSCIDDPGRLPGSKKAIPVKANTSGYVAAIEAERIGIAAMTLGAGRETKDSKIDLAVGIRMEKKVGDYVEQEETIAVLYVNDDSKTQKAQESVSQAYSISNEPVQPHKLILGYVDKNGVKRY